jgi:hypothetical protein
MVDMDAQILAAAKVLPDATKIELFDRNNFKRWQQKVLFFFFFLFFLTLYIFLIILQTF